MLSCSFCNCHNHRNFAWQHFQKFLSLLKKHVFLIFEWSNAIIRKKHQRHPSFIFSLLFDGNCNCLPGLPVTEPVMRGSLPEPVPARPNVWVSYPCVEFLPDLSLNRSQPDLSLNRFRRDPTYRCHTPSCVSLSTIFH